MAETKTTKPKKEPSLAYYEAVGRCSEAVARVRAYLVKKGGTKIGEVEYKAGAFIVNDKVLAKAFPLLTDQMVCQKPLKIPSLLIDSSSVSKSQVEESESGLPLIIARAFLTHWSRSHEDACFGT
jgi:hypothetical protein